MTSSSAPAPEPASGPPAAQPAGALLGPASRHERTRARNHDALVAAARTLFTRDGFDATTIAAITAEADLGFGTFYRYFEDKQAALRAVLEDVARDIDTVVHAGDDTSVPAADALANLIRDFVAAGRRNSDALRLWWEVGFRRPPGHPGDDNAAPLPVKLGAAVHRIVSRGITSGEFQVPDALTATQFISSGLMFVLAPLPQQIADETLSAGLQQLALRTLLAGPAPAHNSGRDRA